MAKKRAKPKEHTRTLKSGKKIVINKGVKGAAKNKKPAAKKPRSKGRVQMMVGKQNAKKALKPKMQRQPPKAAKSKTANGGNPMSDADKKKASNAARKSLRGKFKARIDNLEARILNARGSMAIGKMSKEDIADREDQIKNLEQQKAALVEQYKQVGG